MISASTGLNSLMRWFMYFWWSSAFSGGAHAAFLAGFHIVGRGIAACLEDHGHAGEGRGCPAGKPGSWPSSAAVRSSARPAPPGWRLWKENNNRCFLLRSPASSAMFTDRDRRKLAASPELLQGVKDQVVFVIPFSHVGRLSYKRRFILNQISIQHSL